MSNKVVNDKKALRKKLFVDRKVQGALVARTILYWMACIVTVSLMILCWRIITGPIRMFYTHLDDMWFFYGPAIVASLLLLPLVVVDILRLSNRFTGPLVRLRRSMRALTRGEHVEPIEFRSDDFWHEFADDFNALLAKVQSQEPTAEDTTTEEQPEEEALVS
jgi:hypothetical protein